MLRTRIKELTCIKYKRSMRRIVETDCVLAATKHLSSRVINGIARYFMRFLLQACSQTDTGVSFSTCGRCGPIKYRDPHQRVIFTLFRQIDTSKSQLTSRKKYRALFKFRSIHHDQLLTRQSIESIFINRINVVALSIKIYYRTRMVTSEKKKRESRETICKLLERKKQTNNSASYKIHDSSKSRQAYLSRNTSHRNYGLVLWRFLQIKSSTRNDSRAHMEGNIYFLFRSGVRLYVLMTTTLRRSRIRLYLFID